MKAAAVLGLALGPLAAVAQNDTCRYLKFQVYAEATNLNLTSILSQNLTDAATLYGIFDQVNNDTFPPLDVAGTQMLAGRYCEPTVENENGKTLQLLFHSLIRNGRYWNGLGKFPELSWQNYFATQGYHTLAIDRLGNGNSSKPDDGVNLVQGPYEVALYTELIRELQKGTTSAALRAFKDVVPVGNSYGSQLITRILYHTPDLVSRAILTGYTDTVRPSLPGLLLFEPIPAVTSDPVLFSDLASKTGYLTSNIRQALTNTYFNCHPGVDFGNDTAQLFHETRDITTVGQFISVYTNIKPPNATDYTGRILVLTGGDDYPFCGTGSCVVGPADCTKLLPGTGERLYPRAHYNWALIPHTGHATSLHYSSQTVNRIAKEFLDGSAFAGTIEAENATRRLV